MADVSSDGVFQVFQEALDNLTGTQVFDERCLGMFLESSRPCRANQDDFVDLTC